MERSSDFKLGASRPRAEEEGEVSAPAWVYPPEPLTNRQRDVVECLARGMSNKQIGAALGLKEGTIKGYLHNIRDRDPGKGNRHAAVKYLFRDHERTQAVRLDEWMKKWGDQVPAAALVEMRGICASMVSELLK